MKRVFLGIALLAIGLLACRLDAGVYATDLSQVSEQEKKAKLESLLKTREIRDEADYLEILKEVYGSSEFEGGGEEGDPNILHSGGPDGYGYTFAHVPFNFINLPDSTVDTTVHEMELGDDDFKSLVLPHPFCLYNQTIDSLRVCSNGYLTVFPNSGSAFSNSGLPNPGNPNNVIAIDWDDLWGIGGPADRELRYQHRVGGGRTIDSTIIQYNKFGFFADMGSKQNTFQAILESTGHITLNYLNVDSILPYGPHSATAGIENSTGTIGLQIAYNQVGGNGHIKDSTSTRISPCNPCPITLFGFKEDSVVINYDPSCDNWNHEDVVKTLVEASVCLDMRDVCLDVLEHLQNEDLLEWVKIDFIEPPCYQLVAYGSTIPFKLVTPIRIGQLAGQYRGRVELHGTVVSSGLVLKDTLVVILNVGECHDMDVKDDYANLSNNVMEIEAISRANSDGSEWALRAFDVGLPNAREENYDEYDGPGNTPIDCITCDFAEWSPLWHEDEEGKHFHSNFRFTGVGSVTGDTCNWEPGLWKRMWVGLYVPPMRGNDNKPGTYMGRLDCWAVLNGDTVDHDYFDIEVKLARIVGPNLTSSSFGGDPSERGNLLYWGDFTGVGLTGGVSLYRQDPESGIYNRIEDAPREQKSTYLDTDVIPGITYRYKLGIEKDGSEIVFGPMTVGGVGHGTPTRNDLFQNFPNPLSQATVISFQLSVPNHTSLKIYDLTGRVIKTLANEEKNAGYYSVDWDRKDDSGKEVANGVYFYRLSSGNFISTRKMIVLR